MPHELWGFLHWLVGTASTPSGWAQNYLLWSSSVSLSQASSVLSRAEGPQETPALPPLDSGSPVASPRAPPCTPQAALWAAIQFTSFFPSTVFVAWHLKCRKLVFYLVKIVSKRSIIPVHVTPPWRESAMWPCSSAASEKLLRRVTSSPQSVMSLKSYCHNPFFSKWYVINAHLCSLYQTHATCSWSVIPSQIFKYFPTLENHVK